LNKDDQFITVLASYASLLQEQGQLREASATMQKALVQLKKTKGMQHEYYPILLENIASLHLRLGKRELAKAKLDSAEAFFDSEKKMNSEAYGAMLLGKGRYHQVSGEYQKAELYLRKGTDLFLKLNGQRIKQWGIFRKQNPFLRKHWLLESKQTASCQQNTPRYCKILPHFISYRKTIKKQNLYCKKPIK
jgi:tetratricopeptide (TPR) repeat protein